ncbi:hypothetical protein J5N97_021119 [Dioscorea zingiberensis]|uniref:Uncharacterized protein n=1 Tax=Dioscorea zingiberensis TaxID=325984 RepID=A0A9D5CHN1_9LILI|nr:hypothetical protein J5N97_021119 [Dioscorea zingiberensis]
MDGAVDGDASKAVVAYHSEANQRRRRDGDEVRSSGTSNNEQVEISADPGLITYYDKGKGIAIRDHDPLKSSGPQAGRHNQLVDRIVLAFEAKKQELKGDHLMIEAPGGKDSIQTISDEEMPLAQLQKEAKLEAMARREKLKEGTCPKKGRVEP